MKKSIGIATVLAFLTIACFLQLSQAQCMAAEPEFISAEKLKSLLDNQADVVVVDTRSRIRYRSEHVPGAISMTYPGEIHTKNQELPRDKTIVFYCS
ncbi:rhodanese-like domain-containing protein [Candidatus Poribacteria bacterium]